MKLLEKYINLDLVVKNLIDSRKGAINDYARLFRIGVRGLRELNTDIQGAIKTVLIDVEDNFTAELPCDYITYNKVGLLLGDGGVALLTLDKQMSLHNTNDDKRTSIIGNTSVGIGIGNDNHSLFRNYHYNGGYYNLLGVGSLTNIGSFRIDDNNGLIVLSSDLSGNQVFLEYLSSGLTERGEYYIDSRLEDSLMEYIYWKSIQHLPNVGLGEKQMARQEYFKQRDLSRKRINPFRIGDANEVIRKTIKSAPRA